MRQHLAIPWRDTVPTTSAYAFLVSGQHDVSVFQMHVRYVLVRLLGVIHHALSPDGANGLQKGGGHNQEAAECHHEEIEQELFEFFHAVTCS
jgi:hypothetical protein